MHTIHLLGALGKDPRINGSGDKMVANFSVASTEGYGEKKRTEWFNCAAFGKTANFASNLAKGDKVYVVGYLRTREYEVNGEKKVARDLMVQTLQATGPRRQPQDLPIGDTGEQDSLGF